MHRCCLWVVIVLNDALEKEVLNINGYDTGDSSTFPESTSALIYSSSSSLRTPNSVQGNTEQPNLNKRTMQNLAHAVQSQMMEREASHESLLRHKV